MWFNYPIIVLFFYILSLLQISFLPHFSILGITPNLVFILFFILIFFGKPDEYHQGIFFAFIAGFILDAFSPFYFGLSILSLLAIYFFMKLAIYFLKER